MAVKRKKARKKAQRKRRTPAQIAATKKLIAFNKRKAGVKKAGKRKVKKRAVVAVTKKRSVSTVKKRKAPVVRKKRSYKTMAKKTRKSKTTKNDFMKIVISGAIAGGGAILGNMATNAMGKVLNITTPQKRNVLGVALAFATAYIAPKFVDKDTARSLSDGMLTISMVSLASTALGKDLISLSGPSDLIISDYGVGAIDTPSIDNDMYGAVDTPDYYQDDYEDIELGQNDFVIY